MYFKVHIFPQTKENTGVSCQGQVTLYKPCGNFAEQSVCLCESDMGARQVPLLCSWVGLMRYQTQTSIHQPH